MEKIENLQIENSFEEMRDWEDLIQNFPDEDEDEYLFIDQRPLDMK